MIQLLSGSSRVDTYDTFNITRRGSLLLLDVLTFNIYKLIVNEMRGRRGRDRMFVGITTTCAINAYHQ
jgi:hypothetical protein